VARTHAFLWGRHRLNGRHQTTGGVEPQAPRLFRGCGARRLTCLHRVRRRDPPGRERSGHGGRIPGGERRRGPVGGSRAWRCHL